jgi:hypothetical protein
MTNIEDVSPTSTNFDGSGHFVTGRMLSLAASQDGQTVFAGSLSSNIWVSEDGGVNWEQITWPQPPDGQFGVAGAMGGCCITDLAVSPDAGRWLVERDPRILADLTGSGRADIVGFGETGVWTALSNGDGSFQPPRVVLANFGYQAGGWQVDKHPRFLADVTGNGQADIVGFGDAGVWVALGNGDGTFQEANLVLEDFGYEAGGWRVERHPRFLADVAGKGRADIVGFGDAGVYIAFSNGNGTFSFEAEPVISDFGYDAGGWRVEKHPRLLADLTGKGHASIVGFGDAGVYVARNNGDGTFSYQPQPVIADFGYDAGGWRVEKHPRFLADLAGTGHASIVGFGDAGVYVVVNNGDGTFPAPTGVPVVADFGYEAGGWLVDKHPRLLADIRGTGSADIVGFGDAGVYVALGNGDGTFQAPALAVTDFGFTAGGWRVEKHPRFVANIRGAGPADIVGCGDAGVYVALSNSDGTIQPSQFVLANFGYALTVIAISQSDRQSLDSGIWRSSDGGQNWTQVHQFPRGDALSVTPAAGQLVWAPGTGNLVFAAGGSALAVSSDGGATFQNVMRMQFQGGSQSVNHVAVAATPPGSLLPPIVYALFGDETLKISAIFVSLNGGGAWIPDGGAIPPNVGDGVGLANSQAPSVFVVSPRSPLEVFLTVNNVDGTTVTGPALWRGDYSQFPTTQQSMWLPVQLPKSVTQFSGNVFLAATQPGHGDVLFYSPQSSQVFVGPLDPNVEADWQQLDLAQVSHVDLHGIFFSADFAATFVDGQYQSTAGTVWQISDGGICRSTDGGINFELVNNNIRTLSSVNIAGVALESQGPAISLNTGDNDGFFTSDAGQHWHSQDYGGGDDDCSFADPLRPHSMLVFTPRWDVHGNGATAATGQTLAVYENSVGQLANAGSSANRHMILGPPPRPSLPAPQTTPPRWNASSGFGLRGFRPIVLNMPGDDPHLPGDYIFIRFNTYTPTALLRTQQLFDITDRNQWETPGGWSVDKHVRLIADLTGSRRGDIVGFGDAGVWTALSNGDGTYQEARFVLADFGYEAGGWRVDRHPRFLADVTGNGKASIVAFGDAGVYVAIGNGDGTFQASVLAVPDFGYEAGGWRVEQHPRFVIPTKTKGLADIVGFGDAGVYIAYNNGDGTFQLPAPLPVIPDFGYDAGGWRVDKHPRFLADMTGNGYASIVGFGDAGVYIALNKDDGSGTFGSPALAVPDFGYDAGGWRVDKHPRFAADLTGKGRADIVGFGDAGVYVVMNNGDGTFPPPTGVPVVTDFAYDAGGWRVEKHPRFLGDTTGNGPADIVGFGDAGVWVAVGNGDGSFQTPMLAITDFGYVAGGWRVEKHPRFVADIRGIQRVDVVGFGDAGVSVGLSNGTITSGVLGTFAQPAEFVITNFGFVDSSIFSQQGPALPAPDAGLVQASGGHTGTVFYVGGDGGKHLWKWTDGLADWQELVPSNNGSASEAIRFFVNPYNPALVYLLDVDHVKRSDDGGVTWQVDASLHQQLTCGGLIPIGRGEDVDGQGDHLDVVLTDMQFDPNNPTKRFAVGLAGAFMTDDGVTWVRLLDTGALRGRPANCYYDWISIPSLPALYVSFAGRSIVKLSPV